MGWVLFYSFEVQSCLCPSDFSTSLQAMENLVCFQLINLQWPQNCLSWENKYVCVFWGHYAVIGDNLWDFYNAACKSGERGIFLLIILKLYLENQELVPGQFILVKAQLCCNSPEAKLNLRSLSRRVTHLGGDWAWSTMIGSINNRVGSGSKCCILPACPDSCRQWGTPRT